MRSSAQFGAENFIYSIEFIERILWATKQAYIRIDYSKKTSLLSYLLVTSSPLHGGHGCRIIVLAGVGGQHRYESHV